ncbi:MAG: tetratricopeptide repeat protein [Burkholderiales bacterium]
MRDQVFSVVARLVKVNTGARRRLPEVAVVVAALFLTISADALAASVDAVVQKIQEQVVAVDVYVGEQLFDSSSGIVVGRGEVVAPCNGIPEEGLIRVRSDGATREGKVTHRDILRNLCLLEVSGLDLRAVEIVSVDTARAGQRVYAISNALGMGVAVSAGVVSALRNSSKGALIQFTAPVAPGSDGGGLFNESGQLVGIIRYQRLDGQNVNFAAPADWITQIATRAASQTALGTATDIAGKFARASRWEDLAAHARTRLAVARDDVEAWRWLALAAEKRSQNQEARNAHNEILRLEPEDYESTLGRGWAQLRLGEHAAALNAAHAALAMRREDAGPWLLAAYAQIALKRPQDVRKSLEAAVTADPWNANAQAAMGMWAADTGDHAAAAAAFRMESKLQPDNIAAWIQLANAYVNLNRHDRAFAAAERALSIDSNSGDALMLEGRALFGLGRTSDGIKTLERAVSLKSQGAHWAWYWLASGYYDLKLYPEAIAAYQEALRIEPKFVLARQWLASSLENCGRFADALAEIDTVEKDNPKLPWIGRRRATIHAVQGLDANATAEYEQSLALEPRQPWVWRALIEVYRRNDRAADARRAYDRLLELDRREAELAYRENFLPFEGSR